MQLQLLEQEANQFGEQLKIIEQQVGELKKLKVNVEKIGANGEKDIFAELGKGIYVKGRLKKSDLLVEVGNKIFVPKSFEEVKAIVDDQVGKLDGVKGEIGAKIQEINEQLNKIIGEAHGKEGKTKKKKSK